MITAIINRIGALDGALAAVAIKQRVLEVAVHRVIRKARDEVIESHQGLVIGGARLGRRDVEDLLGVGHDDVVRERGVVLLSCGMNEDERKSGQSWASVVAPATSPGGTQYEGLDSQNSSWDAMQATERHSESVCGRLTAVQPAL